MAEATYSTSDAARKQLWEEKLYRETIYATYWDKFCSSSDDNVCQEKTSLEKSQGDKETFTLRNRLTGDGVTGDEELTGKEEAISHANFSIELDLYRHAVAEKGELSSKRPVFDVASESRSALLDWGTEKLDGLKFDAITANPTLSLYLDGSGNFAATSTPATAKGALHATNSLITPDFLAKIGTFARNGGQRVYEPLRPIRVEGKKYLVLLVHDDLLCDLKLNSEFKQAMREAEVRGSSNPLFQDAVAIYHNIVVHSHERMPVFTDGGGASVAGGQGVLLGAQALVWAWGRRPMLVEEERDFKHKKAWGWGFMAKCAKPVFDSKDYGSMGIYLSRTRVSDITVS